jgi:hypothetical protein
MNFAKYIFFMAILYREDHLESKDSAPARPLDVWPGRGHISESERRTNHVNYKTIRENSGY